MKTILTISDSVQGTIYDLLRCTNTIKEYGFDPLAVVPRISLSDGTSEVSDVSEMLEYAFLECEFAALGLGFITAPEVSCYVADSLEKWKSAPVICCPSMISDDGEVLVGSEVFTSICDRLLKFTDLLIVNTIEAEAFCGFECPAKNDFLRAAKKIFNVYGCGVFIRGGDKTDWQNVLFDGVKAVWVDAVSYETGYEDKYSLLAAVCCELAEGNDLSLAMPLALDFASGKTAVNAKKAEEEAALKAARAAEAAAIAAREAEEAARAAKEAEEAAEALRRAEEAAKAAKEAEDYKVTRTPVPEFSFGKKTDTPSEPSAEAASTPAPAVEDKPIITSSLVTPGKSIRDIARVIAPVASDEVEHAVTSNIEKPEEPKGEVTSLANSRFLFDSKVNDSITSLQSLKDRLNNLNRLADSGK